MKFPFKITRNAPSAEKRGVFDEQISFNTMSSYQSNRALLLSAVYRCVEVISDSVAQMPIEPYMVDGRGFKRVYKEHPSYKLLQFPNNRMSRYTLVKTLIVSALLNGDGYCYIKRDARGNATALYYIPSERVTIIEPTSFEDDIKYSVVGIKGPVNDADMIHLLNFSYDGIHGVSTLRHARQTLAIGQETEQNALDFYRGGGNLSGLLTSPGRKTEKQKTEAKTQWYNNAMGVGQVGRGLAILDDAWTYTPISVNPSDAQMLESREYNVIDICRFFGVSPVKVFDLSKSSYSTIEATQLAFLTDTLAPLLQKIESEFERKLFTEKEKGFIDVQFDTSMLLRTDKNATASYFSTLFNIGAVSVNDVRQALNMDAVQGGDVHFVQTNLMDVNKAAQNEPSDSRITNTEEE